MSPQAAARPWPSAGPRSGASGHFSYPEAPDEH
jgi:hypothetical protein